MRTKLLLASMVTAAALLAVPFVSSAATAADLQAQLAGLLAQIQVLEGGSASSPVSVGGSSTITGTVVSPANPICPVINRSLSIGSTGSDVSALQAFLQSQGYLNVSATGYFGALTKAAVGKWQAAAGVTTSGNAGFGVFGPLSRSFFSRNCGGTSTGGGTTTGTGSTTGSLNFTASPTSGGAPLTVQFTATAPQGTTLGNVVNFGDGATGTLMFVPTCSSCNAEGTVSHTYASAGTYNATLTNNLCSCPANGICNCPNIPILGTATVEVGATSTNPNISQLNAPGTTTLGVNGIAEVRNENYYFTLNSLTSSSATIQLTQVGCWNSFPSDTPPQIRCMIAIVPIPPVTLSLGQNYTSGSYGITLSSIANNEATFSITAPATAASTVY